MANNITFIAKQVLENAHYAKLAIQEYEGIGRYADNIKNTRLEFFFGFNQKAMLDLAILQICKIYDKSSERYKKHTVFEIIQYLKKNKGKADYNRIEPNLNTYLKNSYFKKVCASELSNIDAFLYEAELIANVLIQSCDFAKLKTFRDKYIAHSEQINKDEIKYLPPLKSIDHIIDIAIDLSILIHNLFSDSSLDLSNACMKTATQNIIKELIKEDAI